MLPEDETVGCTALLLLLLDFFRRLEDPAELIFGCVCAGIGTAVLPSMLYVSLSVL